MRKILLLIKIYIFDKIRPFFNLYNFFIKFLPGRIGLRLFGAKISETAKISGSIRVFEPAWVQLNNEAEVKNLKINGQFSVLIDSGPKVENLIVDADTLVLKNKILRGKDLDEKRVTFSIDLEGGVGLSHASRREWKKYRQKWNSADAARRLLEMLIKYNIPATWAICGHLFLERCDGKHEYSERDWYGDWFKYDPATDKEKNPAWYMPDFIKELKDNRLFEIGYHSFGHFNYLESSRETILKDLEWAKRAREKYGVNLKTFVLPYNSLAHIDDIVAAGFTNLRGYIGQYYLPKTLNFGEFRIYGTSQYIGPKTVRHCIKNINNIVGKNFNYFTHPEDWVGQNTTELEEFFDVLSGLAASKKISLKLIGENNG